jgi:hypothetical protein
MKIAVRSPSTLPYSDKMLRFRIVLQKPRFEAEKRGFIGQPKKLKKLWIATNFEPSGLSHEEIRKMVGVNEQLLRLSTHVRGTAHGRRGRPISVRQLR